MNATISLRPEYPGHQPMPARFAGGVLAAGVVFPEMTSGAPIVVTHAAVRGPALARDVLLTVPLRIEAGVTPRFDAGSLIVTED